jgi:hypothetical protein
MGLETSGRSYVPLSCLSLILTHGTENAPDRELINPIEAASATDPTLLARVDVPDDRHHRRWIERDHNGPLVLRSCERRDLRRPIALHRRPWRDRRGPTHRRVKPQARKPAPQLLDQPVNSCLVVHRYDQFIRPEVVRQALLVELLREGLAIARCPFREVIPDFLIGGGREGDFWPTRRAGGRRCADALLIKLRGDLRLDLSEHRSGDVACSKLPSSITESLLKLLDAIRWTLVAPGRFKRSGRPSLACGIRERLGPRG